MRRDREEEGTNRDGARWERVLEHNNAVGGVSGCHGDPFQANRKSRGFKTGNIFCWTPGKCSTE